jgi:prepilin-type N-terminal cleavage/methylation domain-containing protein
MNRGFTLVELLVVVAIIVVLLALLVPAMDKAIYQADLARCAANQHGVGLGVITYAYDNSRHYPYRPGARQDIGWHHYRLSNSHDTGNPAVPGYDDRPYLRNYLSLKLFLDPFLPKINLENPDPAVWVYSTINLYYGFQYAFYNFGNVQSSDKGMFRVGDRLEHNFSQESRLRRWGYLASDRDDIQENTNNNWGTHPDSEGQRVLHAVDDKEELGERLTYARWQTTGGRGHNRGAVDLNFLRDDGSVERHDRVLFDNDERMEKAPITRNSNYYWPPRPYKADGGAWIHLPRR